MIDLCYHRRMKICTVTDCDRTHYARGLCNMHWQRQRSYGSTEPTRRMPKFGTDVVDRFLAYGWTVTDSGCWEWGGPCEYAGYGAFKVQGKTHKAHRTSFQHFKGPIPDGLVVRHKCDNPPCINPDHLELGTTADNMRDRDTRLGPPTAKATPAIVQEIRSKYTGSRGEQAALASEYGYSINMINRIVRKRSWIWV